MFSADQHLCAIHQVRSVVAVGLFLPGIGIHTWANRTRCSAGMDVWPVNSTGTRGRRRGGKDINVDDMGQYASGRAPEMLG